MKNSIFALTFFFLNKRILMQGIVDTGEEELKSQRGNNEVTRKLTTARNVYHPLLETQGRGFRNRAQRLKSLVGSWIYEWFILWELEPPDTCRCFWRYHPDREGGGETPKLHPSSHHPSPPSGSPEPKPADMGTWETEAAGDLRILRSKKRITPRMK